MCFGVQESFADAAHDDGRERAEWHLTHGAIGEGQAKWGGRVVRHVLWGVAKRTQPQDAGRQILRFTDTIRRRTSCTSLGTI